MFWLSIVANVIIQVVLHPLVAGGNNFVSLASAIVGRAIAFLLLPLLVLGILNAITYFIKKPIRYKAVALWISWIFFFVTSTLSY